MPGILIGRSCDNRDRGAERSSYKPGGAKDGQQTPEAGREAWDRFPLRTSKEGINPADLDSRLLAFRPMKEQIFID